MGAEEQEIWLIWDEWRKGAIRKPINQGFIRQSLTWGCLHGGIGDPGTGEETQHWHCWLQCGESLTVNATKCRFLERGECQVKPAKCIYWLCSQPCPALALSVALSGVFDQGNTNQSSGPELAVCACRTQTDPAQLFFLHCEKQKLISVGSGFDNN